MYGGRAETYVREEVDTLPLTPIVGPGSQCVLVFHSEIFLREMFGDPGRLPGVGGSNVTCDTS